MPRRKPFPPGVYIHVCNRGFHKQQLFFDQDDYDYFWRLFTKWLKRYYAITLVEYCLLPNHIHFIFLNKRYGFSISNLMSKVFAGYSKYFERYCGKEKGRKLLEGPFRANILDTDEYYDWCRFYVRYNAVKHGLVDDMEQWKYSSYHTLPPEEKPTNPKIIINRFSQHLDLQYENEWENDKVTPVDI